MHEGGRNVTDMAAIGGGWAATAAYFAEVVTPIMTCVMVTLSVVWLVWRMVDRWRYGPKVKGE